MLPTKQTFFLIYIALAIALGGCGWFRDDPEEVPYLPHPQIMKDYTLYQAGSYWIYEDSTGSLDSAYVTASSCDTIQDEQLATRINQEFCFSNYHYIGRDWILELLIWDAEFDLKTYGLRESRDAAADRNPAYQFFQHDHPGDTMQTGHTTTYISNYLPQITIQGNSFDDVIVVTHGANWAGNPTQEVWWSPHIGIIRRVMWDGTTWNLVRWNTMQ